MTGGANAVVSGIFFGTPGKIAQLTITTSLLVVGEQGTAYSAILAAPGGVSPHTWTLTSGTLPNGLTLKSLTGVIGGIPTISVNASRLKLTDSTTPAAQTATASLAITIESVTAYSVLVIGRAILLSGSNNSHMVTLVERHSRFTTLIKVPSKESLTWDRGLEMAKHKTFTMATDVNVYFCDPQSPWQRGTNENTNGLLRQYFPRRTDLSGYTQAHLDKIALRLNQRPRKTLGFQTPASKLQQSVSSTG